MTLGPAYCASILDLPVHKITVDHVLAILQPIWLEKAETASRIRGRIEKVLDFAKAKKKRDGENPALWRGNLSALLPSTHKLRTGRNFSAVDYEELPNLYATLKTRNSTSAVALRFLVLTASRTSEVRLATWKEIDLKNRVWTIPAERMKPGKEHAIPLSDEAFEILENLICLDGDGYLFAGQSHGKPLSDMAMLSYLKDLGRSETVHGFRSTFRDWVGDETDYPDRLAETALSHTIRSKSEAAYRRRTAVEKRRVMMQEWADYCSTPQTDDHGDEK